MASDLALTRQRLATFLKDPETIRAFEALSIDVGENLPNDIVIANQNAVAALEAARVALALAGQAMLISQETASEETSIAGPAGDSGGGSGPPGPPGQLIYLEPDPADEPTPIPGPAGRSGVSGLIVANVPSGAGVIEHLETVAAPNVATGMSVVIQPAPSLEIDENDAELLSISAISGEALAGQIALRIAFSELTSGPIKLNYLAA